MEFFVGLHQPSDARHFSCCMISLNRLVTRNSDGTIARTKAGVLKVRRSPIPCPRVFLDSGAFTTVERYGGYPDPPSVFGEAVTMLAQHTPLVAVSTQDYMCEPHIRAKTGGTVADHQRWTIERFDAIRAGLPASVYLLPVVQGWIDPQHYLTHLAAYGDRIPPGAWVGVGSVCRWNGRLDVLERILVAIHDARPDLRLHGFGLKTVALRSSLVRSCLASSDSMAWSTAARYRGGGQNDWRNAAAFVTQIESCTPIPRTMQYRLPCGS